MKKRWKKIIALAAIMLLLGSLPVMAAVATFDNFTLASESHYGGAGSRVYTGFTDGDAYFEHDSADYAWNGFSYSNHTDTTTAGYTNQFSAITGGGAHDSNNYAVSFVPLDWQGGTYASMPTTISFGAVTGDDYNTTISGMYVTNTTYAALSMRDGDGFAKKFGGTTGDDPDWFKLSVEGITAAGTFTSAIDFYLADFRFANNSDDYIVTDWEWLNLSGLGDVVGLQFSLTSSDGSDYGMNTPSYFAMDDLNGAPPVPIPGAVWLLGSGLLGLVGIRRKQKL
jgi:hypothetical protein